jgi:phospholipid/cholesterol/gamma-HCH transport system ATP-binding protein
MPQSPARPHFFEFQNVSKSFDDDHLVLDDCSFFVNRGETAVIMGRSGAGKSVTLKLLLGFLKPDSGRIFIEGQDVTDLTEAQFEELRRRVTMVFQSGALFDSLTVFENVAFPLEVHKMDPDQLNERVDELLDMLEVSEVADQYPTDLSTGTKRAVAVARALAEDPDAILYDEPTTMVDPIMAAHMSDLILKLKKKFRKTSIVVTHDTHLAKKLADRVIFIHDSKIAFFGTWHEFETTSDPYLKNFRLQDELIPALDETIDESVGETPPDASAQARPSTPASNR